MPLIFTLFGSTGDLAQKKIIPSLYTLFVQKKLPHEFVIIAFSRRVWTDQDYRDFIAPSLAQFDQENVQAFLKHVVYGEGIFDSQESYNSLKEKIKALDFTFSKPAQKIYHLAIQPEFYALVFQGLGQSNLHIPISTEKVLPKIIIEKPFGQDLLSAVQLDKILTTYFAEEQIYRIDHYLGKQGLEDMIIDRMQDKKLEDKLTHEHVKSIQVRIVEQIDIQGRGEFYDTVGALRDVGQNHALEMLAVATLDLEKAKKDQAHARAEIVQHLKPITKNTITEHVERAQYEGYLKEKDVEPNSQTETYFKIITEIQTDRWKGVEVVIEGGKALPKKKSEVIVSFKDGTRKVWNMDEHCHDTQKKDAYEILIEHAINNNKDLFVSYEEVKALWTFITPISEHLEKVELKKYENNYRKK